MKTLLFLSIFTAALVAKNISYILPHQHDSALSYLCKALQEAQSSVTIISTKIDSYELKKALLPSVKKKIPIQIISYSDENLGVEWVQYANVSLLFMDSHSIMPLTFSLILIDDTLTCKLSTALDTALMHSTFSFLECSHTQYAREYANKIRNTLLPYSKPYLKEPF